jgi:hypothetical protein
MRRAAARATLALVLMWGGLARAEVGKEPTFFIDGQKNSTLLSAIRDGADPKITFDGHFSGAYVACGTGCGSYWFVDRKTGGVAEVPGSTVEDQIIWAVGAQPSNDTIVVTYGPMDGIPTKCSARHFRWGGKSFVPLDKPSPAKCPR